MRLPDWLSERLPTAAQELITPGLLTTLAVCSALAFVASVVLVPWYFCRIPADHYVQRERPSLVFVPPGSLLRPFVRIGKNLLGALLVLLGFLMLFLPGQGVLTMAVGVLLLDIPGKRRLQHWLISRRAIHRAINALRKRAGQPPLELETDARHA